ncbi:tetratricopeptide repeat-containing sulfotransferase family protein [Luteimonas notoginsengisoli]
MPQSTMSPAASDPRLAGLPPAALPRMQAAMQAIRQGDADSVLRLAGEVLAMAPEHPEALRLIGIAHNASGRHAQARDALQRSHDRRPGDALVLIDLGNAQQRCGDPQTARASWHKAGELAPGHPMPWYNLGRALQLEGRTGEAIAMLSRAVELAPDFMPARILLGDALVHAGRFEEADAHYREALWRNPACGDAWRGLANMKVRPLSDEDREQLALNHSRADIGEPDRVAMGYALGKASEDHGRHEEAFAALQSANARLQREAPWDAAGFSARVDAIIAATAQLPAPIDPALGGEVVFIVGMPRSGSTLFEQILAAHPQVEGASELPDLGNVLDEESARRGRPFPEWIAEADAGDWQRLGRDYLQRTARWRERRPRFTDKMPENWLLAGVLRAMLPAATVLETRRDPLETAWSCYKQHFYRLPHFSCDFDDIAAFMRDSQRAMAARRERDPAHVPLQSYEALLRDPETAIRELLDTCGLAFDPACLAFHAAPRSVRTASATQVRQPLQADTGRAGGYGALLDPLRAALARVGLS